MSNASLRSWSLSAGFSVLLFAVVAFFHGENVEIRPLPLSDGYAEHLAKAISFLVLNYTPDIAHEGFNVVADNFIPSLRDSARGHFNYLAEQIERERESSIYLVTEVKNYPESNFIVIKGIRRRWIGEHAMPPEPQTYVLKHESSKNGGVGVTTFYLAQS